VNGSLGRAIKIIPNSYRFQRFKLTDADVISRVSAIS